MRIGKIELTQERLIIAIVTVGALIALAVYLIFFAPLMMKLKTEYLKCKAAENEVIECRNIIAVSGRVYGKRVLMTEKGLSRAMNELTRHGKTKGIDFISINPGKINKEKGSRYKILPIEMEIESAYEEIGTFLGSLDDLEKCLIKVKSFKMSLSAKDPRKITTHLIVDLYLSGRGYEK
ncbi:MAG: type 4a pilus biogenesis protein PilO [Omnitrophica bacterium]|nr:type 4a pilus biogenesis protein PilO [Candidatus Omnitrophota bacterium]